MEVGVRWRGRGGGQHFGLSAVDLISFGRGRVFLVFGSSRVLLTPDVSRNRGPLFWPPVSEANEEASTGLGLFP